ncbi:MAG: GtrA family protein [Myxococcales bacterium]|nr:GtrA family protein [Myxococcales bacterium]
MNWLELIRRILDIRFIRFAIVGGLGVFVNQAVFTVIYAVFATATEPVRANIAAVIGFVVSCFTNFLANDNWTWRDRRRTETSFFRRLVMYYFVALGALTIQLLTLNLFITLEWTSPWWANLFGIAAGTGSNFILNHFWTFRQHNGHQQT